MLSAQNTALKASEGFHISANLTPEYEQILTPGAMAFVVELERRFGARRLKLLEKRDERQARFNAGERPDFLTETAHIREADWTVRPAPADLRDRRVEITGPVDRKMVINALNSGAKCFMADMEDAHSPTWAGTLEGQINLRDAVRRSLAFTSPEGKSYALNDEIATLIVRPRGWHLPEKHVCVDGRPMSGSLFDFGLYFFHNAREALDRGTGPYYYIPKLESHEEAALWNDIFEYAEQALEIPHGSIRCTVLIETIPAVFEMDEILHALKEYIAGLNCGRWDYIFSFIKRFHADPERVLPDRSQVGMTVPFLRDYSRLLIRTCHRRGAHAMGGMAAQIPIKSDPEADAAARDKVRADKQREVGDGHDGTWVAHPGLVPVALEVFDKGMPEANQLERPLEDLDIGAAELLALPEGDITEAGLRNNVSAALHYTAAWLGGRGAVPIHNLMEDAATAEISRAQLWQWVRFPKGVLNDGRDITPDMFKQALDDELSQTRELLGDVRFGSGHYEWAAELLRDIVLNDDFEEFLTLPAYKDLGGLRPCA